AEARCVAKRAPTHSQAWAQLYCGSRHKVGERSIRPRSIFRRPNDCPGVYTALAVEGSVSPVQRAFNSSDDFTLSCQWISRNARPGCGGMAASTESCSNFVDVHGFTF